MIYMNFLIIELRTSVDMFFLQIDSGLGGNDNDTSRKVEGDICDVSVTQENQSKLIH